MEIAYHEGSTSDSRIVHNRGEGLFYATAWESWYPSFGAFDDRTRFSLHFVSPKKFKFLASGRLVKSEKEKDGYISDWDTDVPLGVVGFNYGDFVEKDQGDANLKVSAYGGKEVPNELKGLKDAIDMAELAGGGKALLQCTLTQSGVSDDFMMRVPLYLTMGKSVQRMGFVQVKGSKTVPVHVPLSAQPDRISINEYHELLAVEHE